MEIEMEIVEMEKPWKTVNKKKKKKDENQLMRRPWDALPSLALSYIFRNLDYKDRFGSVPFVCKTWNSVLSNDPQCWSSMIPEYISPDDAFIKKPKYSIQVDLPSKLLYRRDRPIPLGGKSDDPCICPGVSHLRTFIKNSSTSSSVSGSSTITSLFLDPFSFSYPNNESVAHDEILHLIANCCPNLKHICFSGFYCASIEAVLEVFHRCKKIELINFSDSGYADSEEIIVELVKCLPNLSGIRIAGWKNNYSIHHIHDAIAARFPWIKFQNELLLYHDVLYCDECEYHHRVRVRRPRLHIRELNTRERLLCYYCWDAEEVKAEEQAKVEAEKANWEYLHGTMEEEFYSILKEKKRRRTIRRHHQHQYLVLNTRTKKKNKNEASFMLKMKMRKKRDTYDYQDFYVHAVFLSASQLK